MAERFDSTGAGRVPPSIHFQYRRGLLCADGLGFDQLAEEFGTPAYVYSAAAVDAAFESIDRALASMPHRVAYAVKANSNLALLSRLARAGACADIVSGGELARALRAGFPADKIFFSGVGKTDVEIKAALEAGVRALHVENVGEIDAIESIAAALGKRASIALRVNPNVDPKTHPYIATGLRSSKFGLELDLARKLVPRLVKSPSLVLEGIACHIGSMVLSPEPIAEAAEIVCAFARECVQAGAPLRMLDAGGGWPVIYGDEASEAQGHARFGETIIAALERGGARELRLQLLIEPGRAIVADAGVLLTRVLYVKEQGDKRFVIVDAAMTELIRPALYGSYHAIMEVTEPPAGAALTPADVVGPVCESGDFFARGRALPRLARGDLLVLRGAGAYSAAMASNYNSRPFAPEVLVEAGAARLVRRRQAIDAIFRDELM